MYTNKQFETALLKLKVQIEEIKMPDSYVRVAIGYKDGKRLEWNKFGECFFNLIRMPENDLKFEDNEKTI